MSPARLAAAITLALTIVAPAAADTWTNSTGTDEMTGEKSHYAHSPDTTARKPMGRPYHDVTTSMHYGCSYAKAPAVPSQWAYLWFSAKPNLTGDETKDGYSVGRWRTKWDDGPVHRAGLIQGWGEKTLHFTGAENVIRQAREHQSFTIELPWYGEGDVIFRYSLTGSAKAIRHAQEKCGVPEAIAHLAAQAAEREKTLKAEHDEYIKQIRDWVRRRWVRPPHTPTGLKCVVEILLSPDGTVWSAKTLFAGSGNTNFDRSVEAAILRASPLPEPKNPALVDHPLSIEFES